MESQENNSDRSCRCSFCEARILTMVMSSIFFVGGTVVVVCIIQSGYDPVFAVVALCLVAAVLYVMIMGSHPSKETDENMETGDGDAMYSRKAADVSDSSTQTNISQDPSQAVSETPSSSSNEPIQESPFVSCVTCRKLGSYNTESQRIESANQPPKMWSNTRTSLPNKKKAELAITSPLEMIRGKQNLQSTMAMDHRRQGNSFSHKIPHRFHPHRTAQRQPSHCRPQCNAVPPGTSKETSTDINRQGAFIQSPPSFPFYRAIQNPSSAASTSGNSAVRTLQQNLKANESARISEIGCRDLRGTVHRELVAETPIPADTVFNIPTKQEQRRCTVEFKSHCSHFHTAHAASTTASSTSAELRRNAQSGIAANATTEMQHRLSQSGIETMRKLSHDPETFLDAIVTCQDLTPEEWRTAWELRRQGVSFEQTTRILGLWF